MKYIKGYKIYESMTSLPIERYPVDYECTHIYDISDRLKKFGLNLTNLQPNVPTRNEYHDFNLYDFIGNKIQKGNTIFPKLRLCDEPGGSKDARMIYYTDPGSVILLPKHYDSSKDEEDHKRYVEESKKKLIDNFKLLYKGEQLKDAIKNIDKYVNFDVNSFEWANIALDKIYEEYKQYFKSNYLRVWSPYDNDTDTSFDDNPGENTEHGYPIRKMLHLSDIEKYLESNYNLSDDLFYQYTINNNYVENRYWEKPLGLFLDKNMKFVRKGGKYGMDATPNINSMLGILEMEYKDLIKNNKDELFPIYIDYYKKIKMKY